MGDDISADLDLERFDDFSQVRSHFFILSGSFFGSMVVYRAVVFNFGGILGLFAVFGGAHLIDLFGSVKLFMFRYHTAIYFYKLVKMQLK